MAKDIKFNITDGNFRDLSLCMYFCGGVGIVLAPFHFAVHSHPPATGCILQYSPCQLTVGIVLAFQAVHSHPAECVRLRLSFPHRNFQPPSRARPCQSRYEKRPTSVRRILLFM